MSNFVYMAIMADPTISEEQRKQEKAYKDYVDEHIANVKKAWDNLKDNKDVIRYLETIYTGVSFLKSEIQLQISRMILLYI